MKLHNIFSLVFCLIISSLLSAQKSSFAWPDGKSMALSLSFDDARRSHPVTGRDLFRRIGGKATFYVNPPAMHYNIDGWKDLVSDGHEIGNHTVQHPCSGNFPWSRDKALENYTLASMRQELLEANHQIHAMLGVRPVSFAYTCGNTFVGRGLNQKSYIPLVAELFGSGRGWMNEPFNDPMFADFAMLQGNEMDGKDFKNDILPMIESARNTGSWLLLAGHEIGENAEQTVNITMLEELMAYLQQPDSDIWIATVGEIAAYVKEQRSLISSQLKESLTFCASFDEGLSADYANGDASIYTLPAYNKKNLGTKGLLATEVAIAHNQGVHGHALEFKRKGRPAIYYKSENNIEYSMTDWSGTISMWLSLNPEEDLAPGYTDPIQITDSGYDDAAIWVDFSDKNPRSFRMGAFGDVTVWNPDKIQPDDNPNFSNRLVVAEDRPFNRGMWTHVVISFQSLNSTQGSASLYINGKFQGKKMIKEAFTWDVAKSKIFAGLNYVGLIDELSIFNKALNEQEVTDLYLLPEGIQSVLAIK